MFDLISSKFVRSFAIKVISDDDPNLVLNRSDKLDADLFYVYKFAQIVDNSGIDGYLFGYCGDDLHKTYQATVTMNLTCLTTQFHCLFDFFPELKDVLKTEDYKRILKDLSIKRYSEIYDFNIPREILNEQIDCYFLKVMGEQDIRKYL